MIESAFIGYRPEGDVGHGEFMRRADVVEYRRQADNDEDFMRHWPLETIREYLAGGGDERRRPTQDIYKRCVQKGRAILRGKDGPVGAEPARSAVTTQSI